MTALIRLILTLTSLALRVLFKLRLGIPLLYTILMMTTFSEWATAHNALAVGILIALVAFSAASWIFSLVRKIRAV